MKALIVRAAVALLALVCVPASADLGSPDGATIVASPTTCCPQTINYTAKVQGTWVFFGDWRLVIKRGIQTLVWDSTEFIAGFRYGLTGAILPGDRVTVTLRTVGTVATFGSLTGCHNHAQCV